MLWPMKLEGIHHVTCITGDAPANVEFYAGELGLRMVKKTVNQDDPTVYHLFYADEKGSAGADITFFEYPGAPQGRAGDGMVHRVVFRVGSEESLDFWRAARRRRASRSARSSSTIPKGSTLELLVDDAGEPPLTAERAGHPGGARASAGFAGVRAYASRPERSARLLDALGFDAGGLGGARRQAQRVLRLRPAAGRARTAGARARCTTSRGPRRSRSTRRGASKVIEGGRPADAGDRPLLLQVDLLPRAERRAVRDRDDRPGVHRRRAVRDARRVALAAAELRAVPRAGRADPRRRCRTRASQRSQ